MKYVDRKSWGAEAPRRKPTALIKSQMRGIAVHYEAVDRSTTPHDRCDDVVRGIQRAHKRGNGWDDIAYSWLVCRHGTIFEGRGWGVRTAANGTDEGNDGYHAVCYLDDDQRGTSDLTAAADAAMGEVVRECQARGFGNEVRPHSGFKPTACPGDDLRYWISMEMWKGTKTGTATGTARKGPSGPAKAPASPPKGDPLPPWYKRPLRLTEPMTRGHDVEHVQRRLHLDVDGWYGPNTQAKVRGFQKLRGLTVDGVVGPNTARKLG